MADDYRASDRCEVAGLERATEQRSRAQELKETRPDLPDEVLTRAYTDLATYEARFPVWGFSLFEHGADGVWRPQRDFPFGRSLPGPSPDGGPPVGR